MTVTPRAVETPRHVVGHDETDEREAGSHSNLGLDPGLYFGFGPKWTGTVDYISGSNDAPHSGHSNAIPSSVIDRKSVV